ncbi:hypothetical protein HPB51_016898 [Rhipicephalus microplus]|uniref:Serpin domain-containing protein n=1 Tax=Rhipicephalus microplus TaxID=6941 RepID=A0A9J6E1L3_RHIMP|nr:hypothetical protein HPB51_016898 [Rhipicephalus microplus]
MHTYKHSQQCAKSKCTCREGPHLAGAARVAHHRPAQVPKDAGTPPVFFPDRRLRFGTKRGGTGRRQCLQGDVQRRSVSSSANVQDLRVEGLYHKASLDLTTKGGPSPPGFSTLLSVCSTIPPNEPVRFVVDRPFVFAVLAEGLLLMIGLVRNVQSNV